MLQRFGLLLLLATSIPLSAQLTEGTLKGYLHDQTGQSLAGSHVTVKNEGTGELRGALTDASGLFVVPALAAGSYTVSAQAEHFKTAEQSHVTLNVGQTTEVSIRMELGDRQERVEVVADAITTPVATDARLSDTFNGSQISNLPILQRDIFSLPRLS